MKAEAILLDETSKGLIHTFFYPVRYIQIFRPCGWEEFSSYLREGEAFQEIFQERHLWLVEKKIRCLMNYQIHAGDEATPHHYRLLTEFSCKANAQTYMERWSDGSGSSPQS